MTPKNKKQSAKIIVPFVVCMITALGLIFNSTFGSIYPIFKQGKSFKFKL